MISFFLSDWLVARFLDAVIKGEDVKDGIPDSMATLGIVLFAAAVGVLAWAVRGWWDSRGVEVESEPLLPSTTLRPALFEETAVRSRERRPQPRHRAHMVPAHPPRSADETQVIVPGSYGGDNEETAVLRLNQAPERSGRR